MTSVPLLLDPDARPIIAHRGASVDAPENTLEAFALALGQGADALELDVHLSRDGVPVVIHDPTLLRTTGRAGEVATLPFEAIQEADAGAMFVAPDGGRPWAGRNVRVPALAEVIRRFPNVPLMVEVKAVAAQNAVARVLTEERASERSVVASFQHRALDAFRRPPFLVGASRRDIARWHVLTRARLHPGCPRCLCFAVPDYRRRTEIPRARFVAEARRHGRPVHVWTVDDPARARVLWGRGVSGIITNRPGLIRAARDDLLDRRDHPSGGEAPTD